MLRFTTVLFLCAFAGEASAGVAADDLVEGIGKLFREHPNAGVILEAAERLFWTLATISLVWTMGMQIMRQDIGEVLMELTRFVVVTGIFFWVLDSASRGKGDDGSILNIVNSFFEMSNGSPDATAFIDDANSIARLALQVYTEVIFDTGPAPDADKIILNLLGIGTMIVLCLMAAQFLLLLVAAWMMGYAGIFLLGFGGARWTSPVAIHFYKHVFAIGMCMLVLGFIGHQGYPLLNGLANASTSTRAGVPGYSSQGLMLCVSILFLVLSLKVPQILYSVVTGSQVGIYVGSASMVGSAIGAGSAAALASMNTWSNPVDQTSRHVDSPSRVSVRADSVMEAVHRSAIGIAGVSEPFNTRVSNYDTTVGDRQATHTPGNAPFVQGSSFGASSGASTSAEEPMRSAEDASSHFTHASYAVARRLSSPIGELEPGPDYEAELSAIMESRRIHGSSDLAHLRGGDHMAVLGGDTLQPSERAHPSRLADNAEQAGFIDESRDVERSQENRHVRSQPAMALDPHASPVAESHADAHLRTYEHVEAGPSEVAELSTGARGTTHDRGETSQTRVHDASVEASVDASLEGSPARVLHAGHSHEASAVLTETGTPIDIVPGRVGPTSMETDDMLSDMHSSKHVGGSSSGGTLTDESLVDGHVLDHRGEARGPAGVLPSDSVGIAQGERADDMAAHASSRGGAGGLPDSAADGFATSAQVASGAPADASNHGVDVPSLGSTTPSLPMSSDGGPEKIFVPDGAVDEVDRTRTHGAVERPMPGSIPDRAEVFLVEANGKHGVPTQAIGAVSTSEPGGPSAMEASAGHAFAGIDEKDGTPTRVIVEPVRHDDEAKAIGSVADEMPKGVDGSPSLEADMVNRGDVRGDDAGHHSSATTSVSPVTIDASATEATDISKVEITYSPRDASTSPSIDGGQDITSREARASSADVDASDVEFCTTAQERIRASTYRTEDKSPASEGAPGQTPDVSAVDPRVTTASAKRASRRQGESVPGDSPLLSDKPAMDPPT